MTELPTIIHLYVSRATVPIIWTCVKHFEPIPDKPDEQVVVAGLLNKLAEAMAADSSSPYDALISLTPEEGSQLDFALHMTMTDATLAKKYGGPPDEYVGKVRLSSLSDQVPLMAELLRRLDAATQLAHHEHRLSVIEKRLGIVPDPKSVI